MDDLAPDPTVAALGQLQSLLLGVADVNDFLQQVAELAVDVVDPPVSCGINARLDDRALTVVSSDDRASRMDESQLEFGEGPCLHTLSTGEVSYVPDVSTETRWDAYTAVSREQGMRCSLSLPLTVDGQTTGAMNLFAFHAPHAFDAGQRQRLSVFAAQAAGALQLAVRRSRDKEVLEQLEAALTSRSVIDQALGIVMAQQHCGADDAFALLRQHSSNHNEKLRDVAFRIVQQTSGQAPRVGKRFFR